MAAGPAANKLGWRSREVSAEPADSPRTLFAREANEFAPGSARVAVDCEYTDWDAPIGAHAREIAIIPPVSGG